MLISFAVTNYRSIRERAEISFIADGKSLADERAERRVPGFDLSVVPAVALVGANGSGKSNLLAALGAAADAVRYSQRAWPPDEPPPRDPFGTAGRDADRPTTFELSFTVEDDVFDYQFAIGPAVIEYEQLRVASGGPRSWATLFERNAGAPVKFGRQLRGPRAAAAEMTRPNSLFLSSAAQNNQQELMRVWRWIAQDIVGASEQDRRSRGFFTADRYMDADSGLRERLRKLIASADLGVEDLEVAEVPPPALGAITDVIADVLATDKEDLLLTGELKRRTIDFHHRGDVGILPLEQESAGTQAWFEWAAPVLYTLDRGNVLAADEIDAHLSSHLSSELIALFQQRSTNASAAQIIFEVQDPKVLSMAGLARDQVWVVEKGPDGGSRVTPVTDFRESRRWEPGKAYQHGRFGGLPVVDTEALAVAVAGSSER